VVLGRFRGELTMLDGARDGARGGPSMDEDSYGGGFDDGPPARATPSPSRSGPAPLKDLDDDIPF
jgi:single-strand DNA-binding protein